MTHLPLPVCKLLILSLINDFLIKLKFCVSFIYFLVNIKFLNYQNKIIDIFLIKLNIDDFSSICFLINLGLFQKCLEINLRKGFVLLWLISFYFNHIKIENVN